MSGSLVVDSSTVLAVTGFLRLCSVLIRDPSVDGILVESPSLPNFDGRDRSLPNELVERRNGDLYVIRKLLNGQDVIGISVHRRTSLVSDLLGSVGDSIAVSEASALVDICILGGVATAVLKNPLDVAT